MARHEPLRRAWSIDRDEGSQTTPIPKRSGRAARLRILVGMPQDGDREAPGLKSHRTG